MSRRAIDITGQRFGLLTAIELTEERYQGKTRMWLCRCDCGGERLALGTDLRHGNVKSCGCLSHGHGRGGKPTHGLRGHPLYALWFAMIARCHQPGFKGYEYYGERGIEVCARWRESFANFLADMGERPPNPEGWEGKQAYWTLDRIDVMGSYTKENCRWATHAEQRANRRTWDQTYPELVEVRDEAKAGR